MTGTSTREWFADAAASFTEAVDAIPSAALDGPGLGEWSLRSLIGHTCLGFSTLVAGLEAARDRDSGADVDEAWAARVDPLGYYRTASAAVFADIVDEGGRAGAALGFDPLDQAHDLAAGTTALVDSQPDDALVLSPHGPMLLIDHLAVRSFELTVHTLDISAARETEPPARLHDPLRHARSFAVRLAADTVAGASAATATGRAAFDEVRFRLG